MTLSSSLWSASVLRIDPAAITGAHRSFFDAGAQVATTATPPTHAGLLSRAGMPRADFAPFSPSRWPRRDRHGTSTGRAGSSDPSGPYGASRADGSEYTGAYDLPRGEEGQAILRAPSRAPGRAHRGRRGCPGRRDPPDGEGAGGGCRRAQFDGRDDADVVRLHPAPGTGRPARVSRSPISQRSRRHPATLAVGVNCCPPVDVATALTDLDPAAYELTGVVTPTAARPGTPSLASGG